mgnify:FL=1
MNDNLTSRELVLKTVPLEELSKQQWSTLHNHIEQVELSGGNESNLYKTLETLSNNQAQTELIKNDKRYYDDIKDFIVDNWNYWFNSLDETENWLTRHLVV